MMRPQVLPLVLFICLVALPASQASRGLLAPAPPSSDQQLPAQPDAANLNFTALLTAVGGFFDGLAAPAPGPSILDELASAFGDLASPAGAPSAINDLNRLFDGVDAPGPSPFDELAAAFGNLASPANGPSIFDQLANLGNVLDNAAAPSACLPVGATCQYYTDVTKLASNSGALSFCCSGNDDVACFPAGKADASKGDYPGTCAKATEDNSKALQSALAGLTNNFGVNIG